MFAVVVVLSLGLIRAVKDCDCSTVHRNEHKAATTSLSLSASQLCLVHEREKPLDSSCSQKMCRSARVTNTSDQQQTYTHAHKRGNLLLVPSEKKKKKKRDMVCSHCHKTQNKFETLCPAHLLFFLFFFFCPSGPIHHHTVLLLLLRAIVVVDS